MRTTNFHPSSHRLHGASVSDNLDPAQCALVVLDCQPEVLGSVANSHSVVFRTNSAIDMLRRLGGQVVFTRLAFDDSDHRFTPSTNKEFGALARERRLRNGVSDAELHPGLPVAADDIVVRKTRLGAFSTTNLDEQLTERVLPQQAEVLTSTELERALAGRAVSGHITLPPSEAPLIAHDWQVS